MRTSVGRLIAQNLLQPRRSRELQAKALWPRVVEPIVFDSSPHHDDVVPAGPEMTHTEVMPVSYRALVGIGDLLKILLD